MKHPVKLFTLLLGIFALNNAHGQFEGKQYFDGADTNQWDHPFLYTIDSLPGNIWQVGPPQKVIFDSAASEPNVLVTDTINPYPVNNYSITTLTVYPQLYFGGVYALQWKQKLDMEYGKDGGRIEYKKQYDSVWTSVFNNPYVYKFYGFNSMNVDTLLDGDSAFTGTDSTWRDLWLCFDLNWFYEEFSVRFVFSSDSVDTQQEGWMIDNFIGHITFVHTVKEEAHEEYMKVFPTLTEGRVHIQAERRLDHHIIEHMELFDVNGRLVRKWGSAPTKFFIDIPDLDDGLYYLSVTTNIKTETHRIQLKRN